MRFDNTSEVEFRSWRWMPLAELAAEVVSFRRPVYQRLVDVVAGLDA